MPRRVLFLLGFEIASVVGILSRPDWGSLYMVLLLITRPQDDRPNLQALHFPMVMTLALGFSTLLRLSTRSAQIESAVRAIAVPLAYFCLMIVSAMANGFTPASQRELVNMLVTLAAMFGVLTFVRSSRQLPVFIGTLLLSGLYYVKMAIQNPTFLRSEIENTDYVRLEFRNMSNFGNPNFLALLMVLLIFVGLGFAISGQRKLFALPAVVAVMGYFYVFLKCQSRGATLALAAGLIVFWLAQKHKALTLALGVVLIGIGMTLFAPATFLSRLASITDYSADASATGRLELWGIASSTVATHPLLGVGPGNFAYRIGFNSQHETYLQAASELGIFGLVLLLALYVSSLRAVFVARGIAKSCEGNWKLLRSFGGSLYACLMALFVQGFFTGFAYREFFIIIIIAGYLCRLIANEALAGKQVDAPAVAGAGVFPNSPVGLPSFLRFPS